MSSTNTGGAVGAKLAKPLSGGSTGAMGVPDDDDDGAFDGAFDGSCTFEEPI